MSAAIGRCPIPFQLGSPLVWYDASDPLGDGTVLANNAAVSAWKDKSGNGRHLAQASGASQPLNKTNIVGNLPGILFDGVNDCMTTTDITLPTTMTAAVAFQCTGVNANTLMATFTNTGGRYQIIRYDNFGAPSAGNLACYNGTAMNKTITITAGNSYVFLTQSASTGQYYINGQTVTSGTVSGGSFHFSQIGALDVSFQNPFKGYYYEALIFGYTLNATQLTLLRNYYINKWGISP